MTIIQSSIKETGVPERFEDVIFGRKVTFAERLLSLTINPVFVKEYDKRFTMGRSCKAPKAFDGWKWLEVFDSYPAWNFDGKKEKVKVARVKSVNSAWLAFAKQYTEDELKKIADDMEARSEAIKARLRG